MLKVSRGFTVLWASAVVVVTYLLSLICLNFACKQLDIGVAYAIWTGSGAVLVATIGVLAFHEPLGAGRALGLLLVIGGVALLLVLEGRLA